MFRADSLIENPMMETEEKYSLASLSSVCGTQPALDKRS